MTDERTVPVSRPEGEARLLSRTLRFQVVSGPDQGKVADLPGVQSTIGTGKECDLVLTDPTVSRVHLTARIEGESIRIIDAGSRNGTRIDDLSIRDAYARPDSTVRIGDTSLRLQMTGDVIELPLSTRDRFGALIGKSDAIRRVFALLERIAPGEATVLIEGETGTGKELVAEAIHDESARGAGPFIVFDCSAVSATLIESELFGHLRGAFTGAISDRAGAFEAAHGGTLFLDEVGELPLDLQPKLLRVLERREVRRLGANVARKVDVRVVAATNRSLAREVEGGRFREDLYYRLAVIPVSLPPLRERQGDIPLLVRHFEAELGGARGARLGDEQVSALAARTWPGNVRELRNAVARAVSLGSVGAAGGPAAPPSSPAAPAIDLDEPLLSGRERVAEAYEKAYVELALQRTGGNVSRAAELCKVNRKHIQRAIRRFGLRGDDPSE
ncbi:MAG: sigma 54-interacting transcriptional regulator [Byssovorax sp.]